MLTGTIQVDSVYSREVSELPSSFRLNRHGCAHAGER